MNPRTHIKQRLLAALLLTATVGLLAMRAAPTPQTPKVEKPPPVSTFVIPGNPSQGRDPFFPDSTRLFANKSKKADERPALAGLELKSILGTPPNVFAIINNHTFATGDAGDVITDSGQRLNISCVNINSQAGTATVEAGGASEILHLSQTP